ncbi:MAG: hypothetical protein QOD75_2340 [Blastocatellia bacterium]|nr:hypothetical protein [Blastocatellia bacterium]
MVYRSIKSLALTMLLGFLGAGFGLCGQSSAAAQEKAAPLPTPTPVKNAPPLKPLDRTPASGAVTAEQVVESVIAIYGFGGGRAVLNQVRRNGVERGEITRMGSDGRTETAEYSFRFIRGENADKDKFRVDQKSPTLEYALVFNGGQTWGVMNGASFVPRQEATKGFLAQQRRGLDALLRYKENGSTIAMVNREKQKGLDLFVVDLTDKDKLRTRYFVSAKSLRVLWLEYDEPGADANTPVKIMVKFSDYRYAQNTLSPKHTVTLEDGKQTQEITVKTITYGVKLEDSLFKNPDAQASSTTP